MMVVSMVVGEGAGIGLCVFCRVTSLCPFCIRLVFSGGVNF